MPKEVRVSVLRSREIGVSKHRESSCFGRIPNTAMSIDTDFEPAPKVNVLSAILVISYGAFTFSRALACVS
jgi:hypothetical protein